MTANEQKSTDRCQSIYIIINILKQHFELFKIRRNDSLPPGAHLSHDIIVINIHLIARWWYSFCNKIYTGRTHIHAFIRPYLTICLCMPTLSCDYFMIVLKLPSTGFVLPQPSVLLYRLFCNHKIELWNSLTLCFFVSHFLRLVINSTTPTWDIILAIQLIMKPNIKIKLDDFPASDAFYRVSQVNTQSAKKLVWMKNSHVFKANNKCLTKNINV